MDCSWLVIWLFIYLHRNQKQKQNIYEARSQVDIYEKYSNTWFSQKKLFVVPRFLVGFQNESTQALVQQRMVYNSFILQVQVEYKILLDRKFFGFLDKAVLIYIFREESIDPRPEVPQQKSIAVSFKVLATLIWHIC